MKPTDVNSLWGMTLTKPGQRDLIRQPLYDHLNYALAGQLSLRFFSVGIGGTKTLADTNMTLNGQIPKGWKHISQTIEIDFYPGSSNAAYVTALPSSTPAEGTLSVANFENDVYTFAQGGLLIVTIGYQPYLTLAPLLCFPPRSGLYKQSSLAVADTNTAIKLAVASSYARMSGRIYVLDPELPLPENTNFDVTLSWPAALALPSGFIARVGVRLGGLLFRS